ncbi:unnamed protein product [Peronospora destructor]|uniref:Uncharacterized protein n=1 Tax=Peronospora destructor TaxID=86335 RepID=A0AAV0TCC3_9STRA|nr:unnamed protein product [Peronospora destructor]
MEELTAVSPVKPDVESPQSIEAIEKSAITTQQEPHKSNEDSVKSDKFRTDTDDEEEVEQHKEQHKEHHEDQYKEPHKKLVLTSVKTLVVEPTTSQEENTEPKTPVGQPFEKDFEENDVSVAIGEQSEKEVGVDVQEETTQEQEKENVAEVVRAVQPLLRPTDVKTVASKKVEVHGNEGELTVQNEVVPDEVELKVQEEVKLKIQDEAEPKVQDEVEPKIQDKAEFKLQDEAEPNVQDEAEFKVQDEVETKVTIVEAEEHEVELVIPSPKGSTLLNLVQHDIDDEESDSEDEEEEVAPREAIEEGADLGTPLGFGGGANFDDGQAEFASHRFLGPSVATDSSSVRALHSLRRVALHDKPPRFVSEAPVITTRSASLTSSGESSGRNSSSATVIHTSDCLRSQSEAGFVENMLNTYTLTFTEPVLGFDTNIVMSLENELMVEVWSVMKDSPAQRGGVVVGDNLISAIVQYKLQKKCKHFTPEFFLSLRRDICKGRPDKFEYLGEWIANIVMGTSAAKITVRGIEIPSLPPAARQRFVSHLMPLVSNRTDIEVNIEWLPDDADQASAAGRLSVDRMSVSVFGSQEDDEDGAGNVPDNLEKLRIWISDKKTRTTSPFA